MGQSHSLTSTLAELDSVHMQLVRHTKVLSEIQSLTYEEFLDCLNNLNALSRKCVDPAGNQLVFLVKHGTDRTLLWKATVRIACIKVESAKRQIESYKFLNLKQFMCVFKTFQIHLDNLISSENQRSLKSQTERPCASSIKTTNQLTTSLFVSALDNSTQLKDNNLPTACTNTELTDECCICLDRDMEVTLPCAHSFCTPCIAQWNVSSKTCPICSEYLSSLDDTWLMPDIPGAEEINEKICSEFMNLTKE